MNVTETRNGTPDQVESGRVFNLDESGTRTAVISPRYSNIGKACRFDGSFQGHGVLQEVAVPAQWSGGLTFELVFKPHQNPQGHGLFFYWSCGETGSVFFDNDTAQVAVEVSNHEAFASRKPDVRVRSQVDSSDFNHVVFTCKKTEQGIFLQLYLNGFLVDADSSHVKTQTNASPHSSDSFPLRKERCFVGDIVKIVLYDQPLDRGIIESLQPGTGAFPGETTAPQTRVGPFNDNTDSSTKAGEDDTVRISNDVLVGKENDPHGEEDPLKVIAATAEQGSVTVAANGDLTYHPNGQFDYLAYGQSATDTIAYTVSDNSGNTAEATATVTIAGRNDPVVILSTAPDQKVPAGSQFSIRELVRFSDADLTDFLDSSPANWSVQIAWGDESATTLTKTGVLNSAANQGDTASISKVSKKGNGPPVNLWRLAASHTYEKEGTYQTAIAVNDGNGSLAVAGDGSAGDRKAPIIQVTKHSGDHFSFPIDREDDNNTLSSASDLIPAFTSVSANTEQAQTMFAGDAFSDTDSGSETPNGGRASVRPQLRLDPIPYSQRGEPLQISGSFSDPGLEGGPKLTIRWSDPDQPSPGTFSIPPLGNIDLNRQIASSTDQSLLHITSVNPQTGEIGFEAAHVYQNDDCFEVRVAVRNSAAQVSQARQEALVYFLKPGKNSPGYFRHGKGFDLAKIVGLFRHQSGKRLFAGLRSEGSASKGEADGSQNGLQLASPYFEGFASAGAAVTVVLFDEAGAERARQSARADLTGSWSALIPRLKLNRTPFSVQVSEVAAGHAQSAQATTFFGAIFPQPELLAQVAAGEIIGQVLSTSDAVS